nr:MAG TPA: hypothetical protein [Caudoviricetes sp.]
MTIKKPLKAAKSLTLRGLPVSRGDWIRTSDHSPPRQVPSVTLIADLQMRTYYIQSAYRFYVDR